MSAALLLAGAAALSVTLIYRLRRRRQSASRPAGIPVALDSWSGGKESTVLVHLRRERR